MKCERCGDEELWQEGQQLRRASGPDAVETYTLRVRVGSLTASVCNGCGDMLAKLGWTKI